MTGLDFGSLNDALTKTNTAENLLRSADDEFRGWASGEAAARSVLDQAAMDGRTLNMLTSAGPVSDAYLLGAEPVMLITGPGGSAKTTTSVKKGLLEAQRIWPGSDGVRRYVLGVWRQKYVNLWSATIPSWWKILPKDLPGSKWVGSPPREASHFIRFEDAFGIVELLARFRAFGDAADPADVRGVECTDAYLNEMDTFPEDLMMVLADRVGRDPPFAVIHRYGRIFGDSNAPNVLNYCYRDFYEDLKPGYKLYRQPGGRDPNAENVAVMGRGYWENSARINSHRPSWVRVMVDAKPGYISAEKPVYPTFDDERNIATETIPVLDGLPVLVGVDGGYTPTAVYCQERSDGQLRVLAEIALERGGMKELSVSMLALEARRFEDCHFVTVCDPSMNEGEDLEEKNDLQRLEDYLGRPVKPARSNNPDLRWEAVRAKLRHAVDGGLPGFLLDPSCKGLRRGFAQTYHFRDVQGTNDVGSVQKTFDSHVHDGLQYAAMECGTETARRSKSETARVRQERLEQNRIAPRYSPLGHAARRRGMVP